MKQFMAVLALILFISVMLITGCRPPELEGVVVNMQQGLYEEAFPLAKEAVEKYPENPEAWYRLGLLYEKVEKNYVKMNECFDKSLALSPQFSTEIEQIRTTYFAENYNDALQNYYSKARSEQDPERRKKLYEMAAKKFFIAHQIAPNRTEPLIPMYVSFLEIGDTTSAEAFLNKAVELNPQDDELLVGVGDFYYKINKYAKARELYSRAIEINPQNVNAHLAMGEAYAAEQQWDNAIKHFNRGMELEPENSAIPLRIGAIYSENEKWEEAIPYFKKRIELEPDDKESYEYLSVSYMQVAQRYLDKAAEMEDGPEKNAVLKKAQEVYDIALPFLQNAVQKFPNSALLWNNLGICYAQKGMKEKAKEAFAKQNELQGS
ncbi:MAG: hypothetical protein Kow0042_12480 [Calditrichia bacterium]